MAIHLFVLPCIVPFSFFSHFLVKYICINVKAYFSSIPGLGWAYRGLTGGFLLLRNFSVAIPVNPHVCFIVVLILISMFLR